jgi:hypothetical protein
MPAPVGFDIITGTATVSTPITLGATLLSVAVPARWVVGAVDLTASQLDTATTPLITLNVGDAVDADRYIAGSIAAQAAGVEEYRPLGTAYYRYAAAGAVLVKVAVAPGTGYAGAVSLDLYGYPSADYRVVRKNVLRTLGVLGEGQPSFAEDDALVREALEEVHEMLRGRNLANKQDMAWTLDTLPLFASRPYVTLGAWRLCDVYGIPARRVQSLAAAAAMAEKELRVQTYKRTAYGPVSLEPYADAVPFVTDYGVLV